MPTGSISEMRSSFHSRVMAMEQPTAVAIPRLPSVTNVDPSAVRESVVKVVQTNYPMREQLEAVEQFVFGQDVFVSFPTGSGKSVCYACLPLVFDNLCQADHSIVMVIAPLSILMQDQVATFTERGLKCASVMADSSGNEDDDIMRGEIQLVLASPVALQWSDQTWRDIFLTPVYQDNLVALVVDKAHLVEKW